MTSLRKALTFELRLLICLVNETKKGQSYASFIKCLFHNYVTLPYEFNIAISVTIITWRKPWDTFTDVFIQFGIEGSKLIFTDCLLYLNHILQLKMIKINSISPKRSLLDNNIFICDCKIQLHGQK